MNTSIRILIGIIIILHGLVHPIMAAVPQPLADQSDENPPVVGGFWTTSWLFGKGPAVKFALYALASLTAVSFLVAGIGFISGDQPWMISALLAGTGLSLLSLVVFWNIYLVVGIAIDVVVIMVVIGTLWSNG